MGPRYYLGTFQGSTYTLLTPLLLYVHTPNTTSTASNN